MFSVYDCVSDVFLLSEPIIFVDVEDNKNDPDSKDDTKIGSINRSGLFTFWLVANYRHFMKSKLASHFKSTIKSKLQSMDSLKEYQKLMRIDLNWDREAQVRAYRRKEAEKYEIWKRVTL